MELTSLKKVRWLEAETGCIIDYIVKINQAMPTLCNLVKLAISFAPKNGHSAPSCVTTSIAWPTGPLQWNTTYGYSDSYIIWYHLPRGQPLP